MPEAAWAPEPLSYTWAQVSSCSVHTDVLSLSPPQDSQWLIPPRPRPHQLCPVSPGYTQMLTHRNSDGSYRVTQGSPGSTW